MQTTNMSIVFKLQAPSLPASQAYYVCGAGESFGNWLPLNALRLKQKTRTEWVVEVKLQIRKKSQLPIEFKFLKAGEGGVADEVEWEDLPNNRSIDPMSLSSGLNHYEGRWNHQRITLCLAVNHPSNDQYYVLGSEEGLGSWREKQLLQPVSAHSQNRIRASLSSNNPEVQDARGPSHFRAYTLHIDPTKEQLNYYYIRQGQTLQSETHPGRSYYLRQQTKRKDRLVVLQWGDQTVIVDQSNFDQMLFERLTSSVFLASNLKNDYQFQTVHREGVSFIFHLRTKREDYLLWQLSMERLSQERRMQFQQIVLDNVYEQSLKNEIKRLIKRILEVLRKGHRVCIHCSQKVIQSPAFQMITLTVFKGFTYNQALSQVRKHRHQAQSRYLVAHDVLAIVNKWVDRHR